MKKAFKKAISLLLVAVMVFGAAPLAGFVGVELPKQSEQSEPGGFEKLTASVFEFFDGFATKAEATSYTSGVFTYTVSGSNATITGCATSATGAVVVPDTIDGYKVTTIGNYAFSGCSDITSIDLGKVTTLGYSIFTGCTSLKSITFPNTFTTTTRGSYSNQWGPLVGSSITDVVFEEGTNYIPDYACYQGTSVKNITLPEYEDYDINGYVIGGLAFAYTAIQTIKLPDTLTKIETGVFSGCHSLTSITVPDNVTSVGASAFTDCTNLVKAHVGKSVTSLGSGVFSQCSSLTDVVIGDAVTSIGEYGFSACSKLVNIEMGDKVKTLGNYMFQNCYDLVSVDLNNVSSLGFAIFNGCTELKNLVFPNDYTTSTRGEYSGQYGPLYGSSITDVVFEEGTNYIPQYACHNGTNVKNVTLPEYEDYDINGYVINQYAFANTAIETITLPDTLTQINNNAFQGCAQLTDIVVTDKVTSIGDYAFSGCSSLEDVTIGKGVTTIGTYVFNNCIKLLNVSIGKNVSSIGEYAFNGCTRLLEIAMGEKVKTIGNYFFNGCERLEQVDLKNIQSIGYAIFNGCTRLTEITFPNDYTTSTRGPYSGQYGPLTGSSITDVVFEDGIKNIPEYACNNGTYVKNITLPEYEDYDINGYVIGQYAFANTAIETITLPDTLTRIYNNAFQGCTLLTDIVITDNVISISDYAFDGCSSLKNVTIGKGTTSIGAYVFSNCIRLLNITIGENVSSIGEYAFNGCTRLLEIAMGENVKTIGNYFFNGCERLEQVDLKNVQTIGYAIFNGCTRLTEITFPNDYTTSSRGPYSGQYGPLVGSSITDVVFEDGIKNIPPYACYNGTYVKNITLPEYEDYDINGYVIGQYAFANTAIETITLPDTLTRIYNNAFQGCTSLTDIVVTDNVISISDYAFDGCSSLKNVTIGNSVTGIGAYVFSNCTRLLNVAIGENVSSIGNYTFSGCVRLVDFLMGENVKSIGSYLFNGCIRLENVDLQNVESIGYSLFSGCTRFTEITFPNDYTTSTRGEYSGQYGPLVGSNITDVILEDGMKTVPNYACTGCTTLANAYFPKSVTTVKSNAFPTKGNPADVYYEGTEEEWAAILIETNNDGLINATIHYNYKPEVVSYTATFIVDGETLATYEIEEGAEITVPNAPSKEGYNFVGWTPAIPSAMPSQNITFTAVFEELSVEPLTYNAIFIVDGETLATYEIEEGAEIPVPENPSKDGYTFTGWTPAVPSVMPSQNITFTAVFEEIPVEPSDYTATYYVENMVYAEYAITEGDEITVPRDPSKDGYTFTGWTPAVPSVMPANDIDFYAGWDVNEYTITFIVDDSIYEEYTLDFGSDFPDPDVPSKDGYIFAGWDKVVPVTVPAENMVLTALWEKIEPEEITASYSVEVYIMDTAGVYPSTPSSITTATGIVGETVSVTAGEIEGITLDTNKSVLSAVLAADGSTKIKVYYSRNIYTLTINLGYDTITEKYYFGSLLAEPETPVREGYTFTGWDSELPETMPANNITITVLWEENPDVTPEYEVGDIIEFGSYPQSKVTDTDLIEELNALNLEWISYGYYSGDGSYGSMESDDYMKYADVEFDGERYRAVKFTSNRPRWTYQSPTTSNSQQYKNKYTTNTVYWFKYEPVQWRVLDPDEGLVLSEIIIDAQPYSNTIYDKHDASGKTYYYNDEDCTVYANDYKTSSIREWMNNDFYNTVFTEEEKSQLKEKVLDFTTYDKKTYTVTDKVFVLSSTEANNSNYGLGTESDRYATGATEYAQAQGLYNRKWMLRGVGSVSSSSGDNFGAPIAYVCSGGGNITLLEKIKETLNKAKSSCESSMGIRPAMVINLSASEPSIEDCKHTETTTVTVEPTCTESGYTYTACKACGKIINSVVNLEPNGHTESEVIILPTCTEDGYKYNVCRDCGEVLVEMTLFTATGHKSLDWETTKEATCTEDGEKVKKCEACGEILETDLIPATGHTSGDWETAKEATCTEDGEKVKKCETCGEVLETGSVPATGHKSLDWETTKEPTCTEDGEKVKKCGTCGEVLETGSIPATGHTSGDWETVIEATVTAEGKEVKKCTKCGKVLEEKILPKLTESKDDSSGVIVIYPEDPDEPEITVEVKEERDDTAFNLVNAEMPVAGVKLYDITMFQDGKEIQPKSKVTVKIPLPEDYKSEYSYVYHINTQTKKIEKMNTKVEDINGQKYLVFETTHFSYYAIIEEVVINAAIRNPSTITINYGDSIWLHVDIEGELPEGAKITWKTNNNNFKIVEVSNDGLSCKITPEANGTTTVTVSVVDASGKELATDKQDMTSKAGFFQKIIAFFKKLFGATKTYAN